MFVQRLTSSERETLIAELIEEATSETHTWSLASMQKVRAVTQRLTNYDVEFFVQEIFKQMEEPEAKPETRFKFAQLLNMMKSNQCPCFSQIILQHKTEVMTITGICRGKKLCDPTTQLLNSLFAVERPKFASKRSVIHIRSTTPAPTANNNFAAMGAINQNILPTTVTPPPTSTNP